MMKILVGLSGGVDSAVAAYLLKQQGLDVTCAFMRNWDSMANNDFLGNPNADDDVCPQEKDWMDAKSVADSLGLELLRVDFVKEYWDNVFSNFLQEMCIRDSSSILCALAAKRGPLTTYSLDYEDNAQYFKGYAYQTTRDNEYIDAMRCV